MYHSRIILSVLFICSLLVTQAQQTSSYDAAWKRIDSLVNKKGLTRSALTELNRIYVRAKSEKNDPQLIKALVYRSTLNENIREREDTSSIRDLEKEIITVAYPARSILQSILADEYLHHFESIRWKLYSRTQTTGFNKQDINTWGTEDFKQKIASLYLQSISVSSILKQTSLIGFEPILIKGNVRHLRPTLYDLLVHRALDYFKNDERDITRASYSFLIDDTLVFSEPGKFSTHQFRTKDTGSYKLKALELFQELTKFHLRDNRPDALLDITINRLEFAYQHAIGIEKDSLYISALQMITRHYGLTSASSQAWYLLARFHADKAAQSSYFDSVNRFGYITAKNIADEILKLKDNSEGKANASSLLREIQSKELSLAGELVNVPGEPFRILVRFKNISGIHTRIIRLDKTLKEQLGNEYWGDSYWKKITELKFLRSAFQSIPDARDHQPHRVEISIEALPVGEYALLVSASESFSLNNNPLAVQHFHVSNLAYVTKSDEYYIIHRQSGKPVPNVAVQVWRQKYDSQKNRHDLIKGISIISDNNGFFKLPKMEVYVEEKIELSTKDDHLMLDEQRSFSRPERIQLDLELKHQTFLFTDRSIFRPGQTIYFKGLVIRQEKNLSPVIEKRFNTNIFLFDVNGQKIDSLNVTTNEFGSYSGNLKLPERLLNGQFRIVDQKTNGSSWFNVEEYKRPKFKVELKKPDSAYKLNDTVSISGNAVAFSGNPIGGATVKYRVVRRVMMPFLRESMFSSRIWPPYGREEMEITNGTTITTSDGSFTIRFKAIPDKSISKKHFPVFYYEVTSDITDINGETRSGSSIIAAAFHSVQLRVDVPQKLHTDSMQSIKILTTNLNDVHQKINVNVRFYKLRMPDGMLRQRYWEAPDTFVIRKDLYKSMFPLDVYMSEDEMTTWAKEFLFEVTDTSAQNQEFLLPSRNWQPGWYLIEASSKNKNDTITANAYVNLFNTSFATPFLFAELSESKSGGDGRRPAYIFCTNADTVYLLQNFVGEGKENTTLSVLQPGCTPLQVRATDLVEGRTTVAFIKNNRAYVRDITNQYATDDAKLKITHQTFRDKTLPGSEEKWSVKISGANKDKAAAEVLMSMYDASLDEFNMHQWRIPNFQALKPYQPIEFWRSGGFETRGSVDRNFDTSPILVYEKRYDQLISINSRYGNRMLQGKGAGIQVQDMAMKTESRAVGRQVANEGAQTAAPATGFLSPSPDEVARKPIAPLTSLRKNFNETAFFFPDLKTDSSGNIEFSFTIPEALTSWKWMTLAHTTNLDFGYAEKTIVTQKQLMVQPNPPRFLREGDRMDFSARIVNLSNKEITGQVELQLIDPATNQSVDGWFRNMFPNQFFTAGAGMSIPVSFTIEVPYQYGKPVTYRLVAKSDSLSDGEENVIPVITNRILITESIPLPVKGNSGKQITFGKLLNSASSETLSHHSLTVEFTSNPAWYAVQSLPYLSQLTHENSEQLFNRFYANSLAAKIANASPRLKNIFDSWQRIDTAALISSLERNQELKSVLLQETPWVFEATSEADQKKKIALFFDMVKMSGELENSLQKLKELQSPSGYFSWFRGGPEDRYMTQYIITGLGRLQKLQAIPERLKSNVRALILPALKYADTKIKSDYNLLVQRKINLSTNTLAQLQIQYLYMRSLFTDISVAGDVFTAYNYYRKSSQKFWLQQNRYMQGMVALSLHRTGDLYLAKSIMASIKQNAIYNEETGMYWKDMSGGYYWHQAPIESQALLIEAFLEISRDFKSVEKMKTWLLKNKQTNRWKSSKATADACYALLLQGTDLLQYSPEIEIKLGSHSVKSSEQKGEAGTGYFKKVFRTAEIKPEMGNIQVFVKSMADTSNNRERVMWGAIYWQYMDDMDKITSGNATPLKVNKNLFLETNSDRGPILKPVRDGEIVKVGDKITVRIELRVDRQMEYIHMKDARASSLEPVNVLSGYKWQGGLSYYESTTDASTHFFFHNLPKGTFVFEYKLFVTHAGTYSNGITTIESMYAPEYRSHTEGVRLNIE